MRADDGLVAEAERLCRRLEAADAALRREVRPAVAELVARMRRAGVPVPARLQALEAGLADEALEARFDNVPL